MTGEELLLAVGRTAKKQGPVLSLEIGLSDAEADKFAEISTKGVSHQHFKQAIKQRDEEMYA